MIPLITGRIMGAFPPPSDSCYFSPARSKNTPISLPTLSQTCRPVIVKTTYALRYVVLDRLQDPSLGNVSTIAFVPFGYNGVAVVHRDNLNELYISFQDNSSCSLNAAAAAPASGRAAEPSPSKSGLNSVVATTGDPNVDWNVTIPVDFMTQVRNDASLSSLLAGSKIPHFYCMFVPELRDNKNTLC